VEGGFAVRTPWLGVVLAARIESGELREFTFDRFAGKRRRHVGNKRDV